LPALLAAALALFFSSCSGGSSQPATDVVFRVPWQQVQVDTATYRLHDKSGNSLGSGVLTAEAHGQETTFTQVYSSGPNSDKSTVVADSQTLKATSSTRVISGTGEDETIEVSYTDQGAVIKQGKKQSGLSVPEHAYDNDISLFLWRTIDFHDGYTARYITIITNRRSRQSVDLAVLGHEQVSVPAGQFDAWKLQIKTENATQTAWIADTPERTLLKYDNDRGTIFELENFLQR
jgi:hypothetical protein